MRFKNGQIISFKLGFSEKCYGIILAKIEKELYDVGIFSELGNCEVMDICYVNSYNIRQLTDKEKQIYIAMRI